MLVQLIVVLPVVLFVCRCNRFKQIEKNDAKLHIMQQAQVSPKLWFQYGKWGWLTAITQL